MALVTCWCRKHQVNPDNKSRVFDAVPFCRGCENLHEALIRDLEAREVVARMTAFRDAGLRMVR